MVASQSPLRASSSAHPAPRSTSSRTAPIHTNSLHHSQHAAGTAVQRSPRRSICTPRVDPHRRIREAQALPLPFTTDPRTTQVSQSAPRLLESRSLPSPAADRCGHHISLTAESRRSSFVPSFVCETRRFTVSCTLWWKGPDASRKCACWYACASDRDLRTMIEVGRCLGVACGDV